MVIVAVQKDSVGSCLFVDACEGGRWHHNAVAAHCALDWI